MLSRGIGNRTRGLEAKLSETCRPKAERGSEHGQRKDDADDGEAQEKREYENKSARNDFADASHVSLRMEMDARNYCEQTTPASLHARGNKIEHSV